MTASGHVYSFFLTEISKDGDTEPDLKIFVRPNEESSIGSATEVNRFVPASEADAYKAELVRLRNQISQDMQKAQDRAAVQIEEYRRSYPAKLEFDYFFDKKAEKPPFLVSAIYHDDRFTYIRSSASEKPTVYEIKDKKASLVNFDLSNGLYVVPKIVDHGYLSLGKKRVTFDRRSY